jgi:hypothetical protein
MRTLRAGTVVLAALAAVVMAGGGPAKADDGGGVTVTPTDPQGRWNPPRVDIGVHTPGDAGGGQPGAGPGNAVGAGHRGSSGRPDGCYWVADPGVEAVERGMDDPPDSPPPPGTHLYARMCPGGVLHGWRWLTPAQAGGNPGPAVDPATLAQTAYRQLVLGVPVIRTSPAVAVPQLVRVPTWLWVDRQVWAARSRTAAVPGLSATATARPVRVSWSTGDGVTVVCRGPGTAFRAGVDRASGGSPDCGHTYLRASAGQAGGVFVVTATVQWSVSWAGGGQAGVLPPLTSAATVTLRVAESQALNDE